MRTRGRQADLEKETQIKTDTRRKKRLTNTVKKRYKNTKIFREKFKRRERALERETEKVTNNQVGMGLCGRKEGRKERQGVEGQKQKGGRKYAAAAAYRHKQHKELRDKIRIKNQRLTGIAELLMQLSVSQRVT